MKKIILRSSLIVFILILIVMIIIVSFKFFEKQKQIKKNEETMKLVKDQRDKLQKEKNEINEILKQRDEELRKKIDLNNMTVAQKDNLIIRCQKEIKKQDEVIDKLKNIVDTQDKTIVRLYEDLEKSNKLLKKDNKGFGFSFYAMPGVSGLKSFVLDDKPVDFVIIVGGDYIKYFLGKRIGLSIGLWVQPVKDFDIGPKFAINISLP